MRLLVDGVPGLMAFDDIGVGPGTAVKPVPKGMSISAGGLVEVQGGAGYLPDDARAWGYLVDA